MNFTLKKVCGQPANRTIELRCCVPAEAEAVFTLQNEVHAAMPNPEQFVPDTLANIRSYLAKDICIGAWDGERLGAYFILRCCGEAENNYANVLGIPRSEWYRWANADSVIVHADWRGNGLQRVLTETAIQWLPPYIVCIGATISPDNQYSLRNALAMGFTVAKRCNMYGGYDRYVLVKRLKDTKI